MKEVERGIIYFILFCFAFAFLPYLMIMRGYLTEEDLILFYLKIIIFGIPIYLIIRFYIKVIIMFWKENNKYHICYHDPISGPQHMLLDKYSFQYMLGTVKAPYTLAYIWVMCRKFADFKNLKLTIGGEDVYVWAKYPVGDHLFYTRNGRLIHRRRIGSFRLGNNDKPYKPYPFNIDMINTEEELLRIVRVINPKIKNINDIINL